MEVTCGAEGRPASPPPPEQSASPPALTSVQASSPCSGLGGWAATEHPAWGRPALPRRPQGQLKLPRDRKRGFFVCVTLNVTT